MKNFLLLTLFSISQFIFYGYGEEVQHQINLEDIEHDNVLNERKIQQSKEHEKQIIQHFHPANIEYEQHQIGYTPINVHNKDNNHRPPPSLPHNHKMTQQDDQQVQYITPATAVPDHRYSPHTYVTSAISSNVFRVPYTSRQTPFKPIIPKQNTHMNHQQQKQEQLQPQTQPEFVYLQSSKGGPDEQGQYTNVGGITYANPQDNDAYTVVNDNKQTQASQHGKATREDPTYQQQHQQQHDRQPAATEYLQYVPVIARGPSPSEAYVMMAPLPAGYLKDGNKPLTVTPSVVGYSHSSMPTFVPFGPPSHPNAIQYASVPTAAISPLQGGIQYLNSNDIQSSDMESQNIHSSLVQDIQYANPNEIEPRPSAVADKSKQHFYAPRHPERHGLAAPQPQDLTKLHSLDTHKVIPLQYPRYTTTPQLIQSIPQQQSHQYQQQQQQQQQIIHHPPSTQSFQIIHPSPYTSTSSATFDLFSNRKAKSLLDSYIPSWVVIQKQRSINQNNIGPLQEYTPLESTYNTIAYSAPESQGQRLVYYSGVNLKRSPKGQKTIGL